LPLWLPTWNGSLPATTLAPPLTPMGLAAAFAAQSSAYGVVLALPLVGLLSVFARERRVRIDHELELRDAVRGRRARAHGAGAPRDAEFAALHDVGKVRVPEGDHQQAGAAHPGRATPTAAPPSFSATSSRPTTSTPVCTAARWSSWRKVMERHTVDGERLLPARRRAAGGDRPRRPLRVTSATTGAAIRMGSRGEQIPLPARIVSCCDAYNAMTTDRSYRKALPRETAIAELRAGSGTQFDPRVVSALVASLGLSPLRPGRTRSSRSRRRGRSRRT
jgi:HD domain-containing protein